MRCHVCNSVLNQPDDDIICDGCGMYVHRKCWRQHWCGVLTDRNGMAVILGSVLTYQNTTRTYKVSEIVPTFTKGGTCYGIRQDKKGIYPQEIIRPRLMEVIS